MESPKNRVRVNIYGEEYTVRSDGDEGYIREVSGYVDRKMREIADKLSNKSPSRVAILAALNITDEFFREKKKEDTDISAFTQRASDMITMLDDKLSDKDE
jgi:cell division protein ZapA